MPRYECSGKVENVFKWEVDASHNRAEDYIDEGHAKDNLLDEIKEKLTYGTLIANIECTKIKGVK